MKKRILYLGLFLSFILTITNCSLMSAHRGGDKNELENHHSLIKAIYDDKLNMVEKLVLQGVNVNSRGNDSLTPLCWASMFGRYNIVKFLVTHGAQINVKDKFDNSPIYYA